MPSPPEATARPDKKPTPAPAQPQPAAEPVLPWLLPGKAPIGPISARKGETIGSKRGKKQPITGADFIRSRPPLSAAGRVPWDRALSGWLEAQPRAVVEIGLAVMIAIAAVPGYFAWNLFRTSDNSAAAVPDTSAWPRCPAGKFETLEACFAVFPGSGTLAQIAVLVHAPLKAMVLANQTAPETVVPAGTPVAIWRASREWPQCRRLTSEADACSYRVGDGISVDDAAQALNMTAEQLLKLNAATVVGGQFLASSLIYIWRD